jgi:polyribonucleotide nucleotidyltransferase
MPDTPRLGTVAASAVIGDAEIRFESGKIAGQAGGAVVAYLGETILLCTTTASRKPKEHLDFFPLTVDYEEKMYAAGKIPGGFFKREGRPSENAILTARLVDRPMRPTFHEGLRNEIQILLTTLSADQIHTPDVLAINAASMATMLAGIPFDGPVAGLRLGMDHDGRWIPFPTFPQLDKDIVFDLVVAGRLNQDSDDVDILMVEAEATAQACTLIELGATKPTEQVISAGLAEAKTWLRQLCDLQLEFRDRQPSRLAPDLPLYPAYADKVYQTVLKVIADDLAAVLSDADLDKQARTDQISQLREKAIDAAFQDAGDVEVTDEELERQARNAFRSIEKTLIRRRVVQEGIRIDGRGPKDIRPLSADVGLLPRAHGSGLFTRGETQVINILTLGMLRDAQRIDTIDPETEKRYIHHYNFPPYSTGETGFMRGPKRREIGHGALAERSLLPVIPDVETFPYALRLVSEVMSSNGSTSMASVCASTLSLMDAGVPITAPVAGIAMGLIHEDGKYTTLTDILGAEDAFGDMDFKVAGTSEFITGLQLDTKLSGIPADVLAQALEQAREARLEILMVMTACISEPRMEMNPHAPRVLVEYIPADKIGEVIGPKGKIIREITEESGAEINVDDVDGRGVVHIYSSDADKAQIALDRIRAIANPVVPKEGERYYGTVVKTADFGAFVSLTPGSDGLLHISKLGGSRRLAHADEAVQVGDKMWVEVTQVKDGRKFSLDLVDGPGGPSPARPPSRPEQHPPRDRDRDRDRPPRPDRSERGTRTDRGDRGRIRTQVPDPGASDRGRERAFRDRERVLDQDDADDDGVRRRHRRRS